MPRDVRKVIRTVESDPHISKFRDKHVIGYREFRIFLSVNDDHTIEQLIEKKNK